MKYYLFCITCWLMCIAMWQCESNDRMHDLKQSLDNINITLKQIYYAAKNQNY